MPSCAQSNALPVGESLPPSSGSTRNLGAQQLHTLRASSYGPSGRSGSDASLDFGDFADASGSDDFADASGSDDFADASLEFGDFADASDWLVLRSGAPASTEMGAVLGVLGSVIFVIAGVKTLAPASDGRTGWGLFTLEVVRCASSDRVAAPVGVAGARRAMDRRISRAEDGSTLVTTTKKGSRAAELTSMPCSARSSGIGLR